MKHFLNPTHHFLPRLAAGLGACLLAVPLLPACAQDEPPAKKQGQMGRRNGEGRRNAGQQGPRAGGNQQGAQDEAMAPIVDTRPALNAGQDFPIQAPMSVPIPASNAPIPPGAIFAAPDGKANNAGTSANAPTTVESALQNAPVGGTIIVRGGTYRTGKIFLPRRLTLQAYPGESPWFNGSVVVSDWVKDGDAWRRDGWTAEFAPEGRLDKIVDANYPMGIYGDQVFIDGKAKFQVGARVGLKPGQFFVDHAKDALYIGDDPAGKTVEATVHDVGLSVAQRAGADAAGSVVRGVGFTHYAQRGMVVSAPRVLVENCAFAWNGNYGLRLQSGAGGVAGPGAEECIVRGCTLTANGQLGLWAGKAHRLLVEKCLISYNNVEGFRRNWGASGFKGVGFDGLVFRDNVVEHNNSMGIWLDVNTNAATVVRNVSRFNKGAGIFFEISDKAIIAFNVSHRNGDGILLSNSHNARVYNNTLADNDHPLRVNQGARVNTGREGGTPDNTVVANTPPGGTFTTRGHVFVNNILWSSRPNTRDPLFHTMISTKQPPAARLSRLMVTTLAHNAFHRAGLAQPANLINWSPSGEGVVGYATLADFAAATGSAKNSLETSGADVYFVDAAQGDFRLKPDSPARGKGAPLPADIAAAAGIKAGAPVHLGAAQQ